MMLTKRNFVIASLLLIAVATGVLWVTFWGWPITRDREYWQLIAGFQHAQLRDNVRRGDQNAGWDFQVELPEEQSYENIWLLAYDLAGRGEIARRRIDAADLAPLP